MPIRLHIIRACQYYGGAVIYFRQAGSDDSDYPFMPILVVQHDGAAVCESFQTGYDLIGLFGHGLVEVFAGFVILIDLSGLFQSNREVLFRQQIYRFLAVLDTSGGVDTRTYLEYYIADGDFFFRQSAYVDNGLQPTLGLLLSCFKP